MGRRCKLTTSMLQEINKSYDAGESSVEIAKRYGVDPHTINRYIWNPRKSGMAEGFVYENRKPKEVHGRKIALITIPLIYKIQQLSGKGLRIEEICVKLNLSYATVSKYVWTEQNNGEVV